MFVLLFLLYTFEIIRIYVLYLYLLFLTQECQKSSSLKRKRNFQKLISVLKSGNLWVGHGHCALFGYNQTRLTALPGSHKIIQDTIQTYIIKHDTCLFHSYKYRTIFYHSVFFYFVSSSAFSCVHTIWRRR